MSGLALVVQKIVATPLRDREFSSLPQVVGECLEEALKYCLWSRAMEEMEIRVGVWDLYKSKVLEFRKTSPCHCVLRQNELACLFCPLDASKQEELEFRKKSTILAFVIHMSSWSEFRHYCVQ